MKIRFNWRLPIFTGTCSEPETRVAWCMKAGDNGFDAVLLDPAPDGPDPMTLALALARKTKKIDFIVAHRPGRMSPTLFVQQINTSSLFSGGRINLLMREPVGDYTQAEAALILDEYISICKAFWRRQGPVDFSGSFYRIQGGLVNTPFALEETSRPELFLEPTLPDPSLTEHADTLISRPEPHYGGQGFFTRPQARDRPSAMPITFICGPTREKALRKARFRYDGIRYLDSDHHWKSVTENQAERLLLAGSACDIAGDIKDLAARGINTLFVCCTGAEMEQFGHEIIPLTRRGAGYEDDTGTRRSM